MKYFLSLCLLSLSALGGTLDQDPIAKLYKERFDAARVPSFREVTRGNFYSMNTSPHVWSCHVRSLYPDNFDSSYSFLKMYTKTPEILVDRGYDNDRDMEYFITNGELQNIHVNKKPGTKKERDYTFVTLRVDELGNLLFEAARTVTKKEPLVEFENQSSVTGKLHAKIIQIGYCTKH